MTTQQNSTESSTEPTVLTEDESRRVRRAILAIPFTGDLRTRALLGVGEPLDADDIAHDIELIVAQLRIIGERYNALETDVSQYRTDIAAVRRIMGTV